MLILHVRILGLEDESELVLAALNGVQTAAFPHDIHATPLPIIRHTHVTGVPNSASFVVNKYV